MVPLQDLFGSLPEGDIQDFRADRITGRGRSEARIDQCPDDQCQQHGFLGTHLDVGDPDFYRGIVAAESCCPPDMILVQQRFGAEQNGRMVVVVPSISEIRLDPLDYTSAVVDGAPRRKARVSPSRQYGEFAPSAASSGGQGRSALSATKPASGSGIPTWMWSPETY